MSNPEAAKVSSDRRELRKKAREAASAKADNVEANLSEIATKSKERAKAKPAERRPHREQVADMRAAAAARADDQERSIRVTPPDVDAFMGRRRRGKIPLHVLNQLANQQKRSVDDDARDIERAVGRVAREAYIGKKAPRTKSPDRAARMREAQAQLEAAKKAKAGA